MAGILYIMATPIGNLSDLTLRAASLLEEVDFIAAEDTRVTLRLLNHLGIKKSLISYNQHNAKTRGSIILDRIENGESCALCSDAGTPAISDPGEFLVVDAHHRGITVTPVPGACAAIAALCASGQVTGRFVFEGFISQSRRLRNQRMAALATDERTTIIYEAPHKLPATLDALAEAFGRDRPLTLCRELTKLYEEITPTTLGAAAEYYHKNIPKGEFVLVVAGAPASNLSPEMLLEEAAALAKTLAKEEGLSASEAAKRAAAASGHSKSAIYKLMQQ